MNVHGLKGAYAHAARATRAESHCRAGVFFAAAVALIFGACHVAPQPMDPSTPMEHTVVDGSLTISSDPPGAQLLVVTDLTMVQILQQQRLSDGKSPYEGTITSELATKSLGITPYTARYPVGSPNVFVLRLEGYEDDVFDCTVQQYRPGVTLHRILRPLLGWKSPRESETFAEESSRRRATSTPQSEIVASEHVGAELVAQFVLGRWLEIDRDGGIPSRPEAHDRRFAHP